jgi:hypothetical protein
MKKEIKEDIWKVFGKVRKQKAKNQVTLGYARVLAGRLIGRERRKKLFTAWKEFTDMSRARKLKLAGNAKHYVKKTVKNCFTIWTNFKNKYDEQSRHSEFRAMQAAIRKTADDMHTMSV